MDAGVRATQDAKAEGWDEGINKSKFVRHPLPKEEGI